MRLIPLGVAVVVAALVLVGLGDAPFVDPPEGLHAGIAQTMRERGDFLTPRFNGIRYFDKPPLLYWLMSTSFAISGPTPAAARLGSAIAGVACAAVTARIGMLLGGARLGLLAGLMVAANLGIFVHARLVKPDVLFIFFFTLAYAGFAAAYLGRGGRRGLAVFYVSLALAALTKDLLGAGGPLIAVAIFFVITRERPLGPWAPWWGIALFAVVALPWYLAVEAHNRGFLWYMVVDNHVLNFLRQRRFPDEDVPLSTLAFLAVTVAAFLPWSLAAPWAIARALRRPWRTATDRLWALFAVWALVAIGFFAAAPFKLPHYGLVAFPALALLVARAWEETLLAEPGALPARALIAPVLVVVGMAAIAAALAWSGVTDVGTTPLTWLGVGSQSLVARGQPLPRDSLGTFQPVLLSCTVILGVAATGLAVAVWRRWTELGITVALGGMLAFLPLAGKGVAEYALGRSTGPIVEALRRRAQPTDLLVHEGALENSASVVVALDRPVKIVDGRLSSLAFGATFDDARDVFWDGARLRDAWAGPGRHFLISVLPTERSVVATLPRDTVHLLVAAGGRRLYSNSGD